MKAELTTVLAKHTCDCESQQAPRSCTDTIHIITHRQMPINMYSFHLKELTH